MHGVLHSLGLGCTLVVTLLVGICVHELLHVIPLALADADYTVTVLPDDETGRRTAETESPRFADSTPTGLTALRNGLTGGLVRVEVTHLPATTPEWAVRTAAILPVVLALPLALVAAGALPDPVAAGDAVGTAALVGVTACGLPSPADWAVVWHGSDCYVEE